MKFKFSVVAVLFLNTIICFAQRKDIVVVDNPTVSLSVKEAILILPGFNSKKHGVKDIEAFFSHKGYDVYIPHYLGRDSLQQCVNTVNKFISNNHLLEYKKLHVFSYIAGTWVLNIWLQQHPNNNITSIVYDRSPMQERIPFALIEDNSFIVKLVLGNVLKQFAKTPYPSIQNDSKYLGIIIENKPTKLFLKHKKSALKPGPITFNKDSLHQHYDDYLYECINHDEMYYQFDKIGEEILHFFKNGTFSQGVKKEPLLFDFGSNKITECR